MGILKLLPFIRDCCTKGYYNGKFLYHYAGKRMAIDAHVQLHEFMSSGASIPEGFIRIALLLKGSGIHPIFVFDGKASASKAYTTEKRQALKQAKAEHLADVMATPELFTPTEIEKAEKEARVITSSHIEQAMKTLEVLGIPYVASSGEADLVLAALYRNGEIDGVFSKDSDMIVHGISPLVVGLVGYQTGPLEEYRSDEIKQELGFSDDEFIDFCVLMGCDYTEKIKNIGPANALKFIKEHKNIETIIEQLPKLGKRYQVPEKFDYIMARDQFRNTQPETHLARRYLPEAEPTIPESIQDENSMDIDEDFNTEEIMVERKMQELQKLSPFLPDEHAKTIIRLNKRANEGLAKKERPPFSDVIQGILYLPRTTTVCLFDNEDAVQPKPSNTNVKPPANNSLPPGQKTIKRYFTTKQETPACLFDDE
uniref:Flap endonuclease-1 n=1 Tax=Clandestinovirus TaxID=2831644 RepID=A0A8F8KMG7_9VIRU|nr:flap endonuclease-1 [Clandestinovirus]